MNKRQGLMLLTELLGNANAPLQGLAEAMTTAVVVSELIDALPLTCRLLAAWGPARVDGRPNIGCAACKIVYAGKDPGTDEFILPDDFDESVESALLHFAQMGSDAPMHIQHLFEYKHPTLQEAAFNNLGDCDPAEKPYEWRIFQGLKYLRTLKCANPEHEMELSASTAIQAPTTMM